MPLVFCFVLFFSFGGTGMDHRRMWAVGLRESYIASLKMQNLLEGLCGGRWERRGASYGQTEQKEAAGHQLRMGQQTVRVQVFRAEPPP